MKQELRCHAVLCPRDDTARSMSGSLQDRLHQALVDFRKEKIWRQNARLSLANCLQDNPSMPYRKLLLQAGTTNYKPPIERSKSAPKLTAIEEAELEEEEEAEMEDEEEEEYVTSLQAEEAVVETHADPNRLLSAAAVGHHPHQLEAGSQKAVIAASFLREAEDSEDDEEDENLRRGSYLNGSSAIAAGGLAEEEEEVDSAQQSQSVSPASQGRSAGGSSSACSSASAHRRRHCRCRRHSSPSSRQNGNEGPDDDDDDCHSLSSDQSDSGHGGEEDYHHHHHHGIAQGLGKMKISEQDAISDESGYSEEPIIPPPHPVALGAAASVANSAATESSVTMLTVNLTAGRAVCTSPSLSDDDDDDSNSSSPTADHRLEIMLTTDNCVVSNNNNNNVSNNSGVTVTSKNLAESSRLQSAVVRRSSAASECSRGGFGDTHSDCLTPPRTPDLSPPLLVLRKNSLTSNKTTSSVPPPLLPRPTDLTVRSVLLSEFTTSEKLRYIERSNLKTGGGGGSMGTGVGIGGKGSASLLLNRQEFCINI